MGRCLSRIAAQAPALFGDIYGSAPVLIGLGSVLLWVLGSVLFGASVVRAKVFPARSRPFVGSRHGVVKLSGDER